MQKIIRPTKKQHEILEYIRRYHRVHEYGPTYREIAADLGYSSVATVAVHIQNLIERGHLTKRDNSSRSLELVDRK